METAVLWSIYPHWSTIALYLFSLKLFFLAVSGNKIARGNNFRKKTIIALTVSCRGVLGVQDARFLERPDARVHQLQACCQLFLYVLVSICMCRNKRGKQTWRERKTQLLLPPSHCSSTCLHREMGVKPHGWIHPQGGMSPQWPPFCPAPHQLTRSLAACLKYVKISVRRLESGSDQVLTVFPTVFPPFTLYHLSLNDSMSN